jgi:hypothetical protein
MNMKVRHSIWGFNKVSFEISTEYERMCNFRPKEVERYNFFILYAMKQIKIKKSFKFAAHQVNENATFLLGFQRGFI